MVGFHPFKADNGLFGRVFQQHVVHKEVKKPLKKSEFFLFGNLHVPES
jgi:hypothetical protein